MNAAATLEKFHQDLSDYTFAWVKECETYGKPVAKELTADHVAFCVGDYCAMKQASTMEKVAQALNGADPFSHAIGYVSGLAEVAKRIYAGMKQSDVQVKPSAKLACPWTD